MTERRFNEAEVAAIFERATETPQTGPRQLPSGEGMTLADLQDIGRQVGISPELIAQAVKSVDQGGLPTSRRFLGFQIGVGRTVELGRKLTEEEWERLVVDLRETFDARGRLKSEGSLRQWTNGNLQALLEPTETGHRVRLRTTKGNARGYMIMGTAMVAFSSVELIEKILSGAASAGSWSSFALVSGLGAALFAWAALRLPAWARLRQRQMEEVATRLAATASRGGNNGR